MISRIAVLLSLQVLMSSAATAQADLNRTLYNYQQMLAGQKQLHELSPAERAAILELDRWLRDHQGIGPSETKEECKDRLQSAAPTQLEQALLDLKCSQRPAG